MFDISADWPKNANFALAMYTGIIATLHMHCEPCTISVYNSQNLLLTKYSSSQMSMFNYHNHGIMWLACMIIY